MPLRKHKDRSILITKATKRPAPIRRLGAWCLFLLMLSTISCDVSNAQSSEQVRMMFYNVENLFDTLDDPSTDDEAFTPEGEMEWTEGRYHNKLSRISWVISNIGEWGFPSIIGLGEVENKQVVRDLLDTPKLRSIDYRFAVSDGADPRGIDVALIWNNEDFKYIRAHEIPHYGEPLYYPINKDPRSISERGGMGRNTLWVTLEAKNSRERFEVFVLHAPSRRGGALPTQRKRVEVLGKIREVVDMLIKKDPRTHIIIMGDFNDNPSNKALKQILRAADYFHDTAFRDTQLYNLAYPIERIGKGTHKHQGDLWIPDQMIVSGSLLNGKSQAVIVGPKLHIYKHKELIDKRGNHARRSFRGTHYTGGYSDHLPIYADLQLRQSNARN